MEEVEEFWVSQLKRLRVGTSMGGDEREDMVAFMEDRGR